MKEFILGIVFCLMFFTGTVSAETYIVCELKFTDYLSGMSFQKTGGYTITKEDGEIIKIVSDKNDIFTSQEVALKTDDGRVIRYFIQKPDKIVLYTTFSDGEHENDKSFSTTIYKSGEIEEKITSATFRGKCTPQE